MFGFLLGFVGLRDVGLGRFLCFGSMRSLVRIQSPRLTVPRFRNAFRSAVLSKFANALGMDEAALLERPSSRTPPKQGKPWFAKRRVHWMSWSPRAVGKVGFTAPLASS
jgi:hypothetical protein